MLISSAVLSAQDVTVPLQLLRGMPYVEVMVNGQGPFTFGIDTGTGGQVLISPELTQKLQLRKTGEMQVGDPSGKNSQTRDVYQVTSLKLGGVEFKNVEAIAHIAQPSPQGHTDGILGFPLFRDYLLTLDYLQSRLVLRQGALQQSDHAVAFTMPKCVPQIELSFASKKLDANLDSRGRGLDLPAAFAESVGLSSPPIVMGRGRTVSSDFEIKGARLSADLELSGYKLPKPFVVLNPAFPVGNIGSVVLRHFAITFDQNKKLVKFESPDVMIDIAPPQPRAPASPSASK